MTRIDDRIAATSVGMGIGASTTLGTASDPSELRRVNTLDAAVRARLRLAPPGHNLSEVIARQQDAVTFRAVADILAIQDRG